jgi:hypothetical protein
MIEKFIVKETDGFCSQGQILKSLSGSEFHRSDLRFLNILEDTVPLKLIEKLLSLDDLVGSLGYHIVELK